MAVEHWVWLQQVLGYNSSKLPAVLHFYGNAEGFFNAPEQEKIARCELSRKQVQNLHTVAMQSIYGIIERCKQEGITILTPEDPRYTKGLAAANHPPCVLYIAGHLPNTDALPAIAVVGPRKPTDYGTKAAFSLSARLAAAGFTVVSGGALGVDAMAHMGAIQTKAKTIAVLGSGICSAYLRKNAPLRELVRKNGCLLSEFPPDAPVEKYNFPIRNRLISALSLGTVVIEAGVHSGALITARHAADQGKDVFVLPGSQAEPNCQGSNQLIQDGARTLLRVEDIFDEYRERFGQMIDTQKAMAISSAEMSAKFRQTMAFLYPNAAKSATATKKAQPLPQKSAPQAVAPVVRRPIGEDVSPTARKVYAAFAQKSMGTDALAERSGVFGGELLSALMELEIGGYVSALPGGRYERID